MRQRPAHLKPRILVVDDYPPFASMMKRVLVDEGYEVDTAQTCGEAVQLAGANDFDVMLADMQLPDGDGAALLEQWPAQDRPRAVALSGSDAPELRERSRRAGFAEHLLKPVDLPDLLDAIKRALGESVPS